MKARAVSGLKPDRSLGESAARIVAVRLDEMLGHAFAALEPSAQREQHDMRIAAKRLRYVLESIGFPVSDDEAVTDEALAAARSLQAVLGDLHDCDEMRERVEEHLDELRWGDAAVVRGAAAGESDLRPELATYAPNRNAYRGLELLGVYIRARRILLFERFAELWAEQLEAGVWDSLADRASHTLDRARVERKSRAR